MSEARRGRRRAREEDGEPLDAPPARRRAPRGSERDDEPPLSQDGPLAGTMRELRLINFMCHKNLRVELKSGVNLITGPNGAGKSAIMIAIMTALGSASRDTSRGATKGFIRTSGSHQESSAQVHITFNNSGTDAFEFETFGSHIRLVTNINKGGTRTYKLYNFCEKEVKNHLGRTAKQTLERMLEQWNIQVNNPCMLLTQEKAKDFIQKASEKSLYSFFLKATQIEEMQNNIENTRNTMKHAEGTHKEKQTSLKKKITELSGLENQIKKVQDLDEMQSKVTELEHEECWSHVCKLQAEINSRVRNLAKMTAEVNRLNESSKNGIEASQKKEAEAEEMDQALQEAEKDREGYLEKLAEAEKQAISLKSDVDKSWKDLSATRLMNKATQKEIEATKKMIREEQKRAQGDSEEVIQQRREKVKELAEEIEGEEVKRRGHEEYYKESDGKFLSMKDSHRDLQERKEGFSGQIRTYQNRIDHLRRCEGDPLKDAGVKVLFEHMKAANFQQPPLGPLFLFGKAKDPKWASPLESVLSNDLNSFIVCSDADMRKAKEIYTRVLRQQPPKFHVLKKYWVKAPIEYQRVDREALHQQGAAHAFDQFELDTELFGQVWGREHIPAMEATMRHVYEGIGKLEKMVFCQNLEEGQRIAESTDRFKFAVDVNGWRFTSGGRTKQYTTKRYQARFFQNKGSAKSNEAEMNDLAQRIEGVKEEMEGIVGQLQESESRLNQGRNEMGNARKAIAECNTRLRNLTRQKEALEEEIEQESMQQSNEGGGYQEQLAILEADAARERVELGKKEDEHAQLEEEHNRRGESHRNLKEEYNKLMSEDQKLNTKLEEALKQAEKLANKAEEERRLAAEREAAHSSEEAAILASRARLVELEEDATKKTPERIQTNRTAERIRRERENFEQMLEQKRDDLKPEEIKERHKVLSEQVGAANEEMGVAKKQLKDQARQINEMLETIDRIRDHATAAVEHYFPKFMSQRGHTGSIDLDHPNELGRWRVNLDGAKERGDSQREVTKAGQLSGGEASYVQLCLILSFWHTAEGPFRVLDEFDVFMDEVNRDKVAKCIAFACNDQDETRRQQIFITPNSLEALKKECQALNCSPNVQFIQKQGRA